MRTKLKDLAGLTFGRWTLLAEAPRRKNYRMAKARCFCGTEREVYLHVLKAGRSRSCGCIQRTHGKRHTREHTSWLNMRARCNNPRKKEWPRYGGRGIHVCDRWKNDFPSFLADMGECPQGLTLGRIDNARWYTPENCRWETRTQQASNRRSSVFVAWKGERHTIQEWSRITGIKAPRLYWRFHQGLPPKRILDPHDARR